MVIFMQIIKCPFYISKIPIVTDNIW